MPLSPEELECIRLGNVVCGARMPLTLSPGSNPNPNPNPNPNLSPHPNPNPNPNPTPNL